MSVYTLNDYLTTVGRRIVDQSGGTLNNNDIVDFLNEELRNVQREIDIENSRYTTPMYLYFGVYQYALPDGYTDFASITRQGSISDNLDFVRENSEEMFWRNWVNRNTFCEQRNGKYQTALINFVNPKLIAATVDACQAFDSQGTWVADTVTSDAANVRTGNSFQFDNKGCVLFDILFAQSGNNAAVITKTDLPAVNLSADSIDKTGTMTMEVYIPSGFTPTSMSLKWGSASNAYYTNSTTTQMSGVPFVSGTKNFVQFDWYTVASSPVGTPNDSSITYLSFEVDYATLSANVYGFGIRDITMREKFASNLHYYSNNLVIDGTTGQPKEQFTDQNDTESYFSCDIEFVDILTYGVMETVFTYYKIDPKAAAFNKGRRDKAILDYLTKFPSQRVIPVVDSYENPALTNRDWWDNDSPNPIIV